MLSVTSHPRYEYKEGVVVLSKYYNNSTKYFVYFDLYERVLV